MTMPNEMVIAHIIIILLLLRDDITKLLARIKHIHAFGTDIELNGKDKK